MNQTVAPDTGKVWIQLTDDEIKMGFVASCIEDVARTLGVPYYEIFERMERVNMLDSLILPHYEALHSESRENLTGELINTLLEWEKINISTSRIL